MTGMTRFTRIPGMTKDDYGSLGMTGMSRITGMAEMTRNDQDD